MDNTMTQENNGLMVITDEELPELLLDLSFNGIGSVADAEADYLEQYVRRCRRRAQARREYYGVED